MSSNESALTDISNLGEFGLIKYLTRKSKFKHPNVLKGIGDDAAVIKSGNGMAEVISTDLLLEGIHFDLAYMPLRHLGYKSVIVNLSDIFAMNAIPYGVTVSIAASNRFPIEALDELYEGINLACEKYGVELMGGDTSSSRQGLLISVTAMGRAKEEDIVYRKGAQKQDLICVTGNLGAAYAGFLVLDREKAVFQKSPESQPDLTDYDYVVGRQLKPEARGDIIQKLAANGLKPTSMMDISDGLASELNHIARQSEMGVSIYAHKIPIDYQTVSVAEEFKISQTMFAMNGGEDYELLMTLPLQSFETLKSIPEISIIGHITEDKNQLDIILENGSVAPIEAQGWQHFSNAEKLDQETTDNQ